MQRQKLCFILSFMSLVYACNPKSMEHESTTKQLFENSIRRDPEAEAAKKVVRLEVGCTAYFVENSRGLTILGAARHCFAYNEEAWCAKPGVFKDNDGHSGSCKRVIAADPARDIMLFEAEYDQPVPVERTFKLAAYYPTVGVRLNMLGYPADPMRQAELTLTENCWVLSGASPSPYNDGLTTDPSQNHNCSTYGGNSGGPMFIEGTREVIGLPFTYIRNQFRLLPSALSDESAYLASMAGFVALKRDILEAEGIAISQTEPTGPIVAKPLVLNPDEAKFAELCASFESLSAESQRTLQALRQAVFTEDCSLAAFRLHHISELNLAEKQLTDLSLLQLPVFETSQIAAVYLQGNALSDVGVLASLNRLRYLNLSRSGDKVRGVGKLQSVSHLDLSSNGIQDLNQYLDGAALPKVQDLILDFNAISDVSALQNFTELSRLSLNGNQGNPDALIASLGLLPQPLERLSLQAAGLKRLAGLQNSLVYYELDLSYNALESIAELSDLVYRNYIQYVDLTENRIADLQALSGFSELRQLIVYNNLISELKPLTPLQQLQTLGLYGNPVRDLSPLNELGALSLLILGQNPNLETGSCPLQNSSICAWY